MWDIVLGQLAYENMGQSCPNNKGCAFDTDILSTLGYYRIFMGKEPSILKDLLPGRSNKLYVLVPDDIPFEPDILRYGGNKRESTYNFWQELLDEFKCEYVELPRGLSREERVEWVSRLLLKAREHKIDNIMKFERE